MFHADVKMNAPKDRTLFDYNCIEDGWPKLRDFLGLPAGMSGPDQKSVPVLIGTDWY